MKHRLVMAWLCVGGLGGCGQRGATSTEGELRSVSAPSSNVAGDTLDRMDARAPVPLLPMMAHHQKQSMRDHLVAVQQIVAAVAADDLPTAEKAALRIGFSESMGQMCSHMGAGAPGFAQQALAFHRTADGIGAAARDGDRAKLLAALSATLEACTTCHAAWKQQVVDQATWDRLTRLQ